MAPKNVIPQSSRKVIQSTSQRSTTTSVGSSGVMTRNMTKADAAMAMKHTAVTVKAQSCKITNLGPNLPEGVDQIASQSL